MEPLRWVAIVTCLLLAALILAEQISKLDAALGSHGFL